MTTSVSQLDVLSCVVLLTNDTYNDTISCIEKNVLTFNITIGGSYDYNVTITNLFGSFSIPEVASKFLLYAVSMTFMVILSLDTSMCIATTQTTNISSPSASPTGSVSPTASASSDNTYFASSIILAILSGLLFSFILFERLRCCCRTASFWSFVFCDCLAKGMYIFYCWILRLIKMKV